MIKIQGIHTNFVSRDGVRFWEADFEGKVFEGVRPVSEAAAREAVRHDERDAMAEAESERRAEFGMSWVAGGGRSEDVGAAWAQGIR